MIFLPGSGLDPCALVWSTYNSRPARGACTLCWVRQMCFSSGKHWVGETRMLIDSGLYNYYNPASFYIYVYAIEASVIFFTPSSQTR